MRTKKLTVGQAIVVFLKNQYVEHDGVENPFFAECLGIFGHGIKGSIPYTGTDGLMSVAIALAAKKSQKENRPVKLNEIL